MRNKCGHSLPLKDIHLQQKNSIFPEIKVVNLREKTHFTYEGKNEIFAEIKMVNLRERNSQIYKKKLHYTIYLGKYTY